MTTLRTLTIIMLVLLAIITVITLLLGGFMPLFSLASGLVFLYYLAIYLGIKFVGETSKKLIVYGISILFIIPIALLIIDPEGFLNFLLQGVHLDMR